MSIESGSEDRRQSEMPKWEKRAAMWIITTMVVVCGGYLAKMDTGLALMGQGLAYAHKKNSEQDTMVSGIEERQKTMEMGQHLFSYQLSSHDSKLEDMEEVEDQVKINESRICTLEDWIPSVKGGD